MTAPVRVEIQEKGPRRSVKDALGRYTKLGPVMRGPVRKLVRHAIVQQFRTSGRYSGRPWPELARSTRRERVRLGYGAGRPMLRREDRLYHSLIRFTHAERQEEITDTGYVLRSLVPYGRFHASGEPRTHLPQRSPIPDPMPESFMVELRKRVKGYIVAGEFA